MTRLVARHGDRITGRLGYGVGTALVGGKGAAMWSRRVIGALVACVVVLSGVQPAFAEDPFDYVRTPYDGTIWEVGDGGAWPLTFERWRGLGYPAWVNSETEYVKVMDIPTVYAYTSFERANAVLNEPITYKQYRAAGGPRVSSVPWWDGITVHRWSTQPELFATDVTGYVKKLTYSEWRDAGFPEFATRSNRGFVRMAWDGSGAIAYMCDLSAGRGGKISYSDWITAGRPTPQTVSRTARDIVFQWNTPRHTAAGTLTYFGPIAMTYPLPAVGQVSEPNLGRDLTYPEWRGMGSPTPYLTNTVYTENFMCGADRPGLSE